jgi:lipopolysaccharide/colanic/teichoic acid biosynthesis glycosyltransferase
VLSSRKTTPKIPPTQEKSGEEFVNVRRSLNGVEAGPFARESAAPREREILSQAAFQRLISNERRRTERSRKPFLLMLLDMGDHWSSDANLKKLNRVLSALAGSTRETDVAGWYDTDRVIGMMFTEICPEDRKTILSTMIARLSEILSDHLSREEFSEVSISFHVFPDDWDHESHKPSNPLFYPDLNKRAEGKRASTILKRAMDVVGSALALAITAPVFLIIALAIKITSKGPILFRQRRVGQGGHPFVFLKFRSMYVGNDSSVHKEYVKKLISGKAERQRCNGKDDGVFKLTTDSRITRIGALLRKTSLDELPQFLNVLKGEMSLVGPRPPIPYEVESYDVWHRRRLLEAKPGITGLWQVSGRSRVTFDEMVRLDLRYARAWSPWMDIKILLRTPLAVVMGEGAH